MRRARAHGETRRTRNVRLKKLPPRIANSSQPHIAPTIWPETWPATAMLPDNDNQHPFLPNPPSGHQQYDII